MIDFSNSPYQNVCCEYFDWLAANNQNYLFEILDKEIQHLSFLQGATAIESLGLVRSTNEIDFANLMAKIVKFAYSENREYRYGAAAACSRFLYLDVVPDWQIQPIVFLLLEMIGSEKDKELKDFMYDLLPI